MRAPLSTGVRVRAVPAERGKLSAVAHDPRQPFVGRDRELAALDAARADAVRGHGGVWLVCGEAGIGKSRLLDELAQRALPDATPLFGRCWEEGGAPAYWPWIQILRGLSRRVDLHDLAAPWLRELGTILPELRPRDVDEPAPLEPEQARFRLLDAVVATFGAAAESHPLAIFLEDLHVADPSSVLLLELLATQARNARVLVVGTYRDALAQQRVSSAPLLARVARDAHVLSLGRLDEDAVERFLAAATGGRAPTAAVAALHRTSEGHPLFLVETARWLLTHGDLSRIADATLLTVPTTLRAVIGERLADLPAATCRCLEVASILGREFTATDVAALGDWDAVSTQGHLEAAARTALIGSVVGQGSSGTYRFGHILVREALYEAVPDSRRRDLHLRAAEHVAACAGTPPWSRLAHHLLEAGPIHRERALEAAVCAAEVARSQLAFDETVTWLIRALDALETLPERDATRRCAILLDLGQARLLAGDHHAGRATCRDAADLARELDAKELLARAALAYGSVFRFGEVDPNLVGLLEDALIALGPDDDALRAHVLARLASALQPAPDPLVPIEMARESIAMARRIGDDHTLLMTLRSACSALADLGDPAERAVLNAEHVTIAQRLEDPVEMLRGSLRLILDRYELGDVGGATRALTDAEALAARIDLPHYGWPVAALKGLGALRAGRFSDTIAFAAQAAAWAEDARDPNAPRGLLLQRTYLERLRGDTQAFASRLGEVRGRFAGLSFVHVMTNALLAWLHAFQGRTEAAAAAIDDRMVAQVIALGDLSLLEVLSEAVALIGDQAKAERLLERMLPCAGRFVSWGMLGLVSSFPVDRTLGLLHDCLGRTDDADACFEAAIADSERTGAAALVPWIQMEHARSLLARSSAAGAGELLEDAASRSAQLEMPGLHAMIARLRASDGIRSAPPSGPSSTSSGPSSNPRRIGATDPSSRLEVAPAGDRSAGHGARETSRFALSRDGELWAIAYAGRVFRMKDSKGMRLLARLVAEPDVDLHVLDLESPDGRRHPGTTSDAGAILDEEAKRQYRARILTLREALEEAEAWNDPGRAAGARAELEAIEQELANAVGLGGRDRRAAAAAERARVNVQRRLKDAIRRIGEVDAELAQYLEQHVRTGAYCTFSP